MKIATWNLQCVRPGFGARSSRIRNALAQIDADIWVLTESHPDFEPASGFVLVAVSAPALDRVRGGCWVAVWAREELNAESLSLAAETQRVAAILVTRPNTKPVLVFGTVLPWRSDRRYADKRGGQAFVHALTIQAHDWDAARYRYPDAELCVAGDFNQEFGLDGPVGTRQGREALERVLAERGLQCVTGGDYDPLRIKRWRDSIDHVVLSHGLRPLNLPALVWPAESPLPRGLSDHYAVCVTVADA